MKLHLKKIVCLAMAVLMIAGLAACGEKAPTTNDHTGKVLTIGIQPRQQVDDYLARAGSALRELSDNSAWPPELPTLPTQDEQA